MISKNISKNEVVDLLNYKFLKMVYIPYSLNFVSIILYFSKKKRASRLQSASQNSLSFASFDTRLFQSLLNFQILNQDKQSDNNESTVARDESVPSNRRGEELVQEGWFI